MGLMAREWLLLSKEEQEKRKGELSKQECFLLRTELDMIHFTEEEKQNMTNEQKEAFIHPKTLNHKEKELFQKKCENVFKEMMKEAEKVEK